jgi:pilus assembly protein CpaC
VVQGGAGGAGSNVTIEYREFGIRLNFTPEIVSDSLIKLHVAPEVSNLDFGNAIILSGFRIPALRSRKLNTVVDVKRSQSLVISGLFNTEREKVRTGIPFLMDIPFLGALFGSSRWQNNESELVVIVTPIVVDPMRPRAQDVLRVLPDTALPAREALEPRLPERPAPRRP